MITVDVKIRAYLASFLVLCVVGCNTDSGGERIKMAEGSLSVRNDSNLDIFPTVSAGRREDFGGVSVGASKTIGFVGIDADRTVTVTWTEGESDVQNRTVDFPLKAATRVAGQVRHFEFCYKGDGKWVLNLFAVSPPESNALLVSVKGHYLPT